MFFFFCKQKTAYEMRISDWSSDVCSSEIKIDKSFILMLESNRSDQAMVRSTVELAHELGFKVVAGGVETAEILDLLRSYGCDVAQGWHIGRPMPAADFAALASNGDRKSTPLYSSH